MVEQPLVLAFLIFFVAVTIVVTYVSQKWTQNTSDFYVAGKKTPWIQTGIAMIGSYLSAASFLGVAGDIAIKGVDRIWLGVGFFGGYMAVLLLIAGPLRNVGSYTVADAIHARFPSRSIKLVVMITTLVISTFYLVPQMLSAGLLFELILGWKFLPVTVVIGSLMCIYIVFGGMKATIYNQLIQALFLFAAMVFLVIFGMIMFFDSSIVKLFDTAAGIIPPIIASKHPDAAAAVAGKTATEAIAAMRSLLPEAPTAMTIGVQTPNILAQISTVLALVFGTAGLPHILIMFYTVKSAKAAKKSVTVAIIGLGIFYLCSIFLGFIALSLVYPQLVDWMAAGKVGMAVNMTVLKVSQILGGKVLVAIATAGSVAAILSTAAGLMITSASTISHDLYKNYINPNATEKQELSIAKFTTVLMSAISIVFAVLLKTENVAWLVTLAFGIAASAIFPVMMGLLWWKRFTRQAAMAGMVTGLVVSLFFIILLLTGVKSFMGLSTTGGPGVFGITLSILVCIVVSYLTKDTGADVEAFFAKAHQEETED
ncbi:MAG: hypothetical protein A2293_00765 [Elusimicrobia bacterium RIFOXYB2_FULL_49_7]|nr:MAG: hypothetical protein A2293_00765 [Elusimicrobia bacterium RIFOXYB2_FULL_49_7]